MGNSDTDRKASYGKARLVAQQICSHASTFHLINSFVLQKPPQGFSVPLYHVLPGTLDYHSGHKPSGF